MGHRDGRLRVHWRHVSIVCGAPGDRSASSGGCLRFRVSASTGSVTRRVDETAGEDFRRKLLPRAEARADREARRRHRMSGPEVLVKLTGVLGDKIQARSEFRGETTFLLESADLREVATLCRDDHAFDYLVDITSIDNFGEEPRFDIVYELYSMTAGAHLRLKIRVSEDNVEVPTVSDIWPTANWHEREMYDMMGLRFSEHPDLRRILMWDGYPYFPLRKEFPLEGLPSNMPDVAFSETAPMEGGPFVTLPSTATTKDREPRARRPIEQP